jgi:preprotein translocase subunit SecD
MNLGLDLKGGAYLLLELDFDSYEKEQLQKSLDQVRAKLRYMKHLEALFM